MQSHSTNPRIELYIDHISLTRFNVACKSLLQPDGCWDFTFLRRGNGDITIRMYHATKPVVLDHSPGDEILGISFKTGVFIPSLPNDARHDKGVAIPFFGPRNFMIGGDRFEIPTPENTLELVRRLLQKGILQTHSNVIATLGGKPIEVSERTLQRAFIQSTGLTQKYLAQIKRAQAAIDLLQSGVSAVQVAGDLGYSDQAHMTKSLRHIMGQTPNQIAELKKSIKPWRSSASSYKLLAAY